MSVTITPGWNTGDINSRVTAAVGVLNDAGTPKVIAPIPHGVRCFDASGNVLWSYSGINQGYDVRDIATADLAGTGYADHVIIASGYYSTATHGKFAIVAADGTEVQQFTGNDFSPSSVARCGAVSTDGTDIYVGHDLGITKFAKSGSTWSRVWTDLIGDTQQIKIADAGNGKRIFASQRGTGAVVCYQPGGTKDWTYTIGNTYVQDFVIAKLDPSKAGLQIAVGKQGALLVLDKDGALSATIATSNVCMSVAAIDHDGDGVVDLYHTDMGRRVRRYSCTAPDTYTLQGSLDSLITSPNYGGLSSFDLDQDGVGELFVYTTNGHCYIYDATLTTQIADLNIGHGQAGGFYLSNTFKNNGLLFPDLDGDGHPDLVISGATGYVDAFTVTGATGGGGASAGDAAGAWAASGSSAGSRVSSGSVVGAWGVAGTAAGVAPAVALSPPTNVVAAPNVGQIDLTWDAAPTATGYDIERDDVIIAYDVAATSYADLDVVTGVEYAYRVRAVR